MTAAGEADWRALRASGDLARFCFICIGVLLHASNETMVATIIPSLVADIDGVELVGWSLSLYEIGSIVAGAAAGRLVSYVSLRNNMVIAALLYAAGAVICGIASTMPIFLAGRLLEGFGGGALVSLSYVSIERLFPRALWPQLFAIVSVVWGIAAFGGPLAGALLADMLSWRWAFGCFALAGLGVSIASAFVLTGPSATRPARDALTPMPPFPLLSLAILAGAIMLVGAAGVASPGVAAMLLVLGLAGIAGFFWLDARNPAARLFPSRALDPRGPVGAGILMMAVFSMGAITFAVYGPLLLTSLHGIPLLATGYIIAAESIAWSVLAILVSRAGVEHEKRIVVGGAVMIALGMLGFAWTIPLGSIPLILVCATLQGGGFGIAWPFVSRRIVTAAAESERTIAAAAVPTMQRIGYALGASLAGMIANASGFSAGLSGQTAQNVATWLFLAFAPLGLVGVACAIALMRERPSSSGSSP